MTETPELTENWKYQALCDIRKGFMSLHEKLADLDATSDSYAARLNYVKTEITSFLSRVYGKDYWKIISQRKDIYSYKFKDRFFPNLKKPPTANTDTANSGNYEKESTPAQVRVNSKYGTLSMVKMLSQNFMEETSLPGYSLPINDYHYLVRQDIIESIFLRCKEHNMLKSMLDLFCTLVCTREYVHLVLQSKTILNIMFNPHEYQLDADAEIGVDADDVEATANPFLREPFREIINCCLFRGIYIIYGEECTIKVGTRPYHRHAFDLELAGMLPLYDGPLSDNPYIPWSLSNEYLYGSHIPDDDYVVKTLIASGEDRGVYSLTSFWERFRIMTNGIFEGLDWDRIFLLGSILSACAIRNPLEKLYACHLPREKDAHFAEVYDEPNTAAIESVRAFWNKNGDGLREYFNQFYPSKDIVKNRVWKDMSIRNIYNLEAGTSDIDIAVDFLEDSDFDCAAMRIFNVICKNVRAARNMRPDEEFADRELTIVRIETDKSYKYYISGVFINRSIEIFRFYGPHPFGGASRFHFAPVRGVIGDQGPCITTSFLCTAMSGQMVDYKWMSSTNSTRDLILKYYLRGFTQIMNKNENIAVREHVQKHSEKWGMLQGVLEDHSRFIRLSDPVFQNDRFNHGTWGGIIRILANLRAAAVDAADDDEILESVENDMAWSRGRRARIVDPINFEKRWYGNDQRKILEDGTSEKYSDNNVIRKAPMGFDIGLRHPSGHVRLLDFWQIQAYTSEIL
jgi:hypothetical protein